jgi:hypothetical protein
MCASAFCWHTACQRRGGNPPAHAFPWGKRERGSSDFLAAAGILSWHDADGRDAASGVCARFFSTTITNIYVDLSISFPEFPWAPTHSFAVLLSALYGPQWARCMLGSDLKPRSITTGDGPGLLGAAIWSAISEGP